MTNHHTPLALTYAQALLDLSNDRQRATETGQELSELSEVLKNVPTLHDYLADPAIGRARRVEFLHKVFHGRVSELVYNFLGVLNVHGRMGTLSQIIAAYADLLDKQLGNIDVDLTTASELDPQQLEEVRQRINKALSKNAIITQHVDQSIIGGLVLKVGDKLIDTSVKQKLSSIRQKLHEAAQKVH